MRTTADSSSPPYPWYVYPTCHSPVRLDRRLALSLSIPESIPVPFFACDSGNSVVRHADWGHRSNSHSCRCNLCMDSGRRSGFVMCDCYALICQLAWLGRPSIGLMGAYQDRQATLTGGLLNFRRAERESIVANDFILD